MKEKKFILILLILSLLLITTYADDQNSVKKEEINLEDGYYKIPIKLWHAMEEKPSMGNKALKQVAEIEVKNKEGNLYIGSDKMTYMNITASLINIYFQKEDGYYHKAQPGSFELEVPKEKAKRPQVFMTSLVNMDEMTKVYVDPKVEPMGDEPIRARIKLDFNNIEKIDLKDAELINKFNNGAKKEEFDKNQGGEVENKGLIVSYEPGCFEKDFSFYGNKLSGDRADKIAKQFNPLDQVNVFNIDFLGELDLIKGNEQSIQATREKIIPQKEFTLKLPLLKFKKEDNLSLYYFDEDKKEKLDFTFDGDYVSFKTKKTGDYVLVKSSDSSGKNINSPKIEMPKSSNSTKTNTLNQGKISRAKAFMASVKKPTAKKMSSTTKITNTQGLGKVEPIKSNSPSLEEIRKSVEAQGQVAKNNMMKEDNENQDLENEQANTKSNTRESKGIMFLVIIVILFINCLSYFIIRKYTKLILDIDEESRFLDKLRRKKWEKNY